MIFWAQLHIFLTYFLGGMRSSVARFGIKNWSFVIRMDWFFLCPFVGNFFFLKPSKVIRAQIQTGNKGIPSSVSPSPCSIANACTFCVPELHHTLLELKLWSWSGPYYDLIWYKKSHKKLWQDVRDRNVIFLNHLGGW